ncbi:MAG: tripartite tricarboxylate transporter substrate binding protein [Thermodesulfobacteriota bacterium]
MKRIMILALIFTLALCLKPFPPLAWSAEKDYPSKQLTYLITFDPGGQSDREARRQQPHLIKLLGQQVIIDYKVGGGGALGWKELANGKPDGYFFAGFNIPHVILQPMQQNVGYKTEQIVPVALFQRTWMALTVLNTSPYKTLKDLVEAAKKDPEKLTVGGSAVFSGPHFTTLHFEKATGCKVTYVPFTGSAPQMTAFLGGHTDACLGNSDDLVRYKDKVRVLAFASTQRFSAFPEAPTFKELGYEVIHSVDRGVAVPPGTPKEIIAKLESVFLKIAQDPAIMKEMTEQGFVPLAMGHAESVDYIKNKVAVYKDLVKEVRAIKK